MDQHQQTLRVRGLPPNTTDEDLGYWFEQRVKRSFGKSIIQSIGQLCFDGNTLTAFTTVTFSSNGTAKKAFSLDRQSRAWDKTYQVELDHEFNGITVLYMTVNPLSKMPDVDVVVLPGLAGHAWNTFSTHEELDRNNGSIQEINWLRDLLPNLLRNAHPTLHYRIMVFGFDASIWMSKSVSDIGTYVGNLLQYLEIERKDDPERPIFFMGHSLGGLISKEAIATWAHQMMPSVRWQAPFLSHEQIVLPVAGCIFLGVPNLGAALADTLSGFLKLLSLPFSVNRANVTDLQAKSHHLMEISSQFREVQKQCNFPVLSIFETEKMRRKIGLIVDKESAVFKYSGMPQPFGIQANHKGMVKFKHQGEHGLQPISSFLMSNASQAVKKRHDRQSALDLYQNINNLNGPFKATEEDPLAILRVCHTVFLVDDSPSMLDKWDILMAVLQEATEKATCYDFNGVDFFLMNNLHLNKQNVRSYSAAWEMLKNVNPSGGTPIYHWICRLLDYFLSDYDVHGKEPHFKNLNLIIVTDGEPDGEEESADEISDLEDARRTKGEYRLIRKRIVEVARHLDRTNARRDQLAIQFCQIGDDPDAARFFQYLDDQIKPSQGLKRDMVDTVKCVSLSDITPHFIEKLLIGSLKRGTDRMTLPCRSYTGAASPPATPSHTTSSPLRPSARTPPASPHQNSGLGFPVRMPMDRLWVDFPHQSTSNKTQEAQTPTHGSQRYCQEFSSSPRESSVKSHGSNSPSPVSPAQEQRLETQSSNRPLKLASPKKKFSLNIFK